MLTSDSYLYMVIHGYTSVIYACFRFTSTGFSLQEIGLKRHNQAEISPDLTRKQIFTFI